MHILLSGEVRIVKRQIRGPEVCARAIMEKGDFLGEMAP